MERSSNSSLLEFCCGLWRIQLCEKKIDGTGDLDGRAERCPLEARAISSTQGSERIGSLVSLTSPFVCQTGQLGCGEQESVGTSFFGASKGSAKGQLCFELLIY